MNKSNIKRLITIIIVICFIFGAYFYQETGNDTKANINYKKKEEVIKTDNELKVYFIDVGQADSILLSNNEEYMLIDAGNNEDGPKLISYLQGLGVTNLNYVIGTHAHEDHIGGMDDIIKNFSISRFFMPDVISTTKTFEDVLDALEQKQLTFETPNENETFSFADTKFNVLYVGNESNDLNDTSIVLKATYHNTSFLFMGDATSKIEKKLENKNLSSDVLKVAHHGSTYSSTTSFLKKVSPKYAVISVGINNPYNHPSTKTISKLEQLGTKVYRTDEDGTIIATSNGNDITFETIKTDTNG